MDGNGHHAGEGGPVLPSGGEPVAGFGFYPVHGHISSAGNGQCTGCTPVPDRTGPVSARRVRG